MYREVLGYQILGLGSSEFYHTRCFCLCAWRVACFNIAEQAGALPVQHPGNMYGAMMLQRHRVLGLSACTWL